jgi:hypothetical protein
VLLNAADYTATNGTSVVLASGAAAGDILETVAYNSIAIGEIGNITGGNTGSLPYQSAANTTSMLAIGNVGQVLTVANGLPVWANATGGGSGNITISNELANANVRYPLFADTANGSANTVYAANTKLQFTPSTGQMTADVIAASEGIILTANTISANYAIPAGYNGMSVGPITVNGGSNIIVPAGSRWAVV